jgi:hypothetical protein
MRRIKHGADDVQVRCHFLQNLPDTEIIGFQAVKPNMSAEMLTPSGFNSSWAFSEMRTYAVRFGKAGHGVGVAMTKDRRRWENGHSRTGSHRNPCAPVPWTGQCCNPKPGCHWDWTNEDRWHLSTAIR